MRNWRNWLVPVLTCLAVACLTVLPLRLSIWRDRELTGTVHAEELGEDSNFPARPPALPGRIWLLAQLESWPDRLTIVDQVLEGEERERAEACAEAELRRLKEAGILPQTVAVDLDIFSGSRIYLRNQADLSSAKFLNISSYDKKTGEYFAIYMDGETDQIVALNLVSRHLLWEQPPDLGAVGAAFLDRLGLSYETEPGSWDAALFRLRDSQVLYAAFLAGEELRIVPQVDWASVDGESGAAYDAAAYGIA